ncbi:hypothetical protein J3Q64DRAFT_1724015 [Phycomyces blakesleeanus]|uniref:Uncharacterized protein n=2 Tax=Phycomyces blakesleeanus TaxID=4837 RepID=A0A162YFW6_PHYB8|nr:hypothetical protein PHYBLDRAFT_137971 [Phycomyces blakesleeanus NRRL 1555(-)]OAD80415.1 hypothetical protein PHYBLDRAFT_137971 [Phycomyces blakesleeanus NRRL 1555(-)]|eukprot:XP_018298455.1 hypothetical protein PHYBLDRAFT_137971 [Phycomyces blakesleeanus NRRL 1555(-)]
MTTQSYGYYTPLEEDNQSHSGESVKSDSSIGGDSAYYVEQENTKEFHHLNSNVDDDDFLAPQYCDNSHRESSPWSFMHRLVSIPIIQDSLIGTQQMLSQHMLGRVALKQAENTLQTMIPLLENRCLKSPLALVNTIGHRSLDIVSDRFPLVNAPTEAIAHAVHPQTISLELKDQLDQAVSRIKAPAKAASRNVNRRLENAVDRFEATLDRYLPQDQRPRPRKSPTIVLRTEEPPEHLRQAMRFYHLANSLTDRLAHNFSDSGATEPTRPSPVWLIEQAESLWPTISTHSNTYVERLPEPVQRHLISPFVEIAKQEYETIRQTIESVDRPVFERARQVITISHTRIMMPFLQHSVETLQSQVAVYRAAAQKNRSKVVSELTHRLATISSQDAPTNLLE